MCVVGIESMSGADNLKLTVSGNDVTLLSNDAMVILRGEHTLGDLQVQQNNNMEYVLTSPGYELTIRKLDVYFNMHLKTANSDCSSTAGLCGL